MDEDQEVVGGEQLLPKAAEERESERGLVMLEAQILFHCGFDCVLYKLLF